MTETTQAGNGEAPPAAVEALRAEPEARVLSWDDLNTLDMLRAKKAKLFGEGVDPQDAIQREPLYATALVIWCIQTRTDPDYTWERALAAPYSTLKVSDAPPPPPARPPAGRGTGSTSRRRSSGPAPAPTKPADAPSSERSST